MTHLEFDFQSPIWRHLYRELARDHTLIRYDTRGNGLSDRDVENVSFETFVGDWKPLWTPPASNASHYSAFLRDAQWRSPTQHATQSVSQSSSYLADTRSAGQSAPNRPPKRSKPRNADPGASGLGSGESGFPPAFHVAIHSGREGAGRLVQCASTDVMLARRRGAQLDRNRRHRCEAAAIQITAPTLVMHARDDARVPFDQGRRLAAGIPGARFVSLPSGNHLILEDEPAFPDFYRKSGHSFRTRAEFCPYRISPNLLQCMSPLMALSCRAGRQLSRQLSWVKRTRKLGPLAAAFDPRRTFVSFQYSI